MNLDQVVENFLPTNLSFHEPHTGNELRVSYRNFIQECIELDDKEFYRKLEDEERNRPEGRLEASETVYTRFIDFYGEPIFLNPEKYPRAKDEFNQMFSAHFFLLATKYLDKEYARKTEPKITNKPETVRQTKNNSGCMIFFSLILVVLIILIS